MAKSKPLQAGDLDRTLDLMQRDEHVSGTQNDVFGYSYSPFAAGIPCHKDERAGDEKAIDAGADRVTAIDKTVFTIRYRDDLKETMQVICEGATYNILSIREGETRRQWSEIVAQKTD